MCLLTPDYYIVIQNFDRYRCTQLVMECLCKFEDDAISRMSLAVISILAAKVCMSDHTINLQNSEAVHSFIQ